MPRAFAFQKSQEKSAQLEVLCAGVSQAVEPISLGLNMLKLHCNLLQLDLVLYC